MTIQVQEIPLSASSQIVSVVINNISYIFTIVWRDPMGYVMDINDTNNNPIVQGISLITGLNLLEQYDYLNFPGELVVLSDGIINQVPTYSDLGISTHLCLVQEV